METGVLTDGCQNVDEGAGQGYDPAAIYLLWPGEIPDAGVY